MLADGNGATFWRWVSATMASLLVMMAIGFGTTWAVFMQDSVTAEEVYAAIRDRGPYNEDRKMIVATLKRIERTMDRHDNIMKELSRNILANTQLISDLQAEIRFLRGIRKGEQP